MARNKGFELSKGEYVIFWDADVIGKPYMLEKMYNSLQEYSGANYAYSNFYLGKKKFFSQIFDSEKLKKQNYITTISLIRRKDFCGFDESLKRFQDWDLWLTLLEKNKNGVWVDDFLFEALSGGTMSNWLPSFAYKKPWRWLPWISSRVNKYNKSKKIIYQKHKLS